MIQYNQQPFLIYNKINSIISDINPRQISNKGDIISTLKYISMSIKNKRNKTGIVHTIGNVINNIIST